MGLEVAPHINDLNIANPLGSDTKAQGDDHIRLIKQVLKTDLPLTAPSTVLGRNLLTSATPQATRAFLGMPVLGYRNRVINGDFLYDQRFGGVPQAITAGSNVKYVADRFFVYSSGADITAVNLPTIGDGVFQISGGSLGVTGTGVGTRLPQSVTKDLGVEPMTLSVKLMAAFPKTVTWSVYVADTTNTFGTVAFPTKTLSASGTFNVTTTNTQFSANFTLAGGGFRGVEILFTTTSLGSGDSIQFSRVQLEKGTIANSDITYDYIDPIIERQRCQHYYSRARASVRSQTSAGGQAFASTFSLPVEMFKSPTATYVAGTGSILNATPTLTTDARGGWFEVVSSVAGDCFALGREYEFDAEIYS